MLIYLIIMVTYLVQMWSSLNQQPNYKNVNIVWVKYIEVTSQRRECVNTGNWFTNTQYG
jgi:hypothetical protein